MNLHNRADSWNRCTRGVAVQALFNYAIKTRFSSSSRAPVSEDKRVAASVSAAFRPVDDFFHRRGSDRINAREAWPIEGGRTWLRERAISLNI